MKATDGSRHLRRFRVRAPCCVTAHGSAPAKRSLRTREAPKGPSERRRLLPFVRRHRALKEVESPVSHPMRGWAPSTPQNGSTHSKHSPLPDAGVYLWASCLLEPSERFRRGALSGPGSLGTMRTCRSIASGEAPPTEAVRTANRRHDEHFRQNPATPPRGPRCSDRLALPFPVIAKNV